MGSKWPECPLTDFYDISSGLSKPAADFGSGYPFVSFKDVFGNYFLPDELVQLVQSTDQERKKCSVKRGDVFLTRTSETMHELGMSSVALRDYENATFNGFTKRLRPKPDCDLVPEYVGYYLRSPKFRHSMLAFSTMSTRASLNNEMIGRLTIEVPPRPVQQTIAHVLKTLDKKVALNRQMNEALEQMAQALFKSWFVDFEPVIDNALDAGNPIPEELEARAEQRKQLRDAVAQGGASVSSLPDEIRSLFPSEFELTDEMEWIPKGWKSCTFGDVSECLDKHRVPLSKKQREEKKPGSVPYYGATSVMDYINEWIFDGIYLLVGEDGSVVKNDGSPFVQYIWGETWVNNHAHVLKGKGDVSTEHLMLFMKDQNLNAYVTGAVQLKINQKNMNRIPFVKASMEINQCFSEWIDSVYSKVRALTEEMMTLTTLRDSLLPKLISGELQIPDAEQRISEALS